MARQRMARKVRPDLHEAVSAEPEEDEVSFTPTRKNEILEKFFEDDAKHDWPVTPPKVAKPAIPKTQPVKAAKSDKATPNVVCVRDRVIETYLNQAAIKGVKGFYSGTESLARLIGIPVPLPLQYLMNLSVLRLETITHVIGVPGSFKSALLAEMYRLNDVAGGVNWHDNNESKFSPTFYRAILRDVPFSRLRVYESASLEEWEAQLKTQIAVARKQMSDGKDPKTKKKIPGLGKVFSFLFGVDPVTGKLSQESMDRIESDGSAGRAHPTEALSITSYLKDLMSDMSGFPFSVILINQMKTQKNRIGILEKRCPGGQQIKFQVSTEWEMSAKKRLRTSRYDLYPINIKSTKSSEGVGAGDIRTRLISTDEFNEQTGAVKQISYWDWDWATIDLLERIVSDSAFDPHSAAKLKQIGLHLHTKKGDKKVVAWCDALGVKEKSALAWPELGAVIRENKEWMPRIQGALGIVQAHAMSGDYDAQTAELRKAYRKGGS